MTCLLPLLYLLMIVTSQECLSGRVIITECKGPFAFHACGLPACAVRAAALMTAGVCPGLASRQRPACASGGRGLQGQREDGGWS